MSRPPKTTFTLSKPPLSLTKPPLSIEVSLPWNLTEAQLLAFGPFNIWLETLQKSLENQHTDSEHPFKDNPYGLKFIDIYTANWFETRKGPKIGFLTMEAGVRNDARKNNSLPGVIFLRGGSVAMLMIIKSDTKPDDRWVVVTQQPRIPAGSLDFFEIPAGMIDENEKFDGAAAREITEETGITVSRRDLIDMTALALGGASESHLQKAMYPSPGGCDEWISLFLYQATFSETRINAIKNKLRSEHDEDIIVKLVRYEELWKEGARDAKTLAAWAIYEGLVREGKIQRR